MAEIGISPEVGVRSVDDDAGEDLSSPRNRAFVAGDNCGARCDLRLCLSIILTAQASRSTGVRLAAWRNASDS